MLTVLYKKGLRLELLKCYFGRQKVKALGHKVTQNGNLPSESHVKAVRERVKPASDTARMSFLGLINYFLQFIDHYAEMTGPLYNVLKSTEFAKKKRAGKRFLTPH